MRYLEFIFNLDLNNREAITVQTKMSDPPSSCPHGRNQTIKERKVKVKFLIRQGHHGLHVQISWKNRLFLGWKFQVDWDKTRSLLYF